VLAWAAGAAPPPPPPGYKAAQGRGATEGAAYLQPSAIVQ
jgi:hypothetical protein